MILLLLWVVLCVDACLCVCGCVVDVCLVLVPFSHDFASALCRATIGIGIDELDRRNTWMNDAQVIYVCVCACVLYMHVMCVYVRVCCTCMLCVCVCGA